MCIYETDEHVVVKVLTVSLKARPSWVMLTIAQTARLCSLIRKWPCSRNGMLVLKMPYLRVTAPPPFSTSRKSGPRLLCHLPERTGPLLPTLLPVRGPPLP